MEQHSLHTGNKVTFLVFSDNYLFIYFSCCILTFVSYYMYCALFVLYQLYLQMIVIKINLSCTFGDI